MELIPTIPTPQTGPYSPPCMNPLWTTLPRPTSTAALAIAALIAGAQSTSSLSFLVTKFSLAGSKGLWGVGNVEMLFYIVLL